MLHRQKLQDSLLRVVWISLQNKSRKERKLSYSMILVLIKVRPILLQTPQPPVWFEVKPRIWPGQQVELTDLAMQAPQVAPSNHESDRDLLVKTRVKIDAMPGSGWWT